MQINFAAVETRRSCLLKRMQQAEDVLIAKWSKAYCAACADPLLRRARQGVGFVRDGNVRVLALM